MPTLERVHTTPPLVDAAGFAWPPPVTVAEPCPACDTGDQRCVVCNSTGQIRISAGLDAR
jgi:hypothetical protein